MEERQPLADIRLNADDPEQSVGGAWAVIGILLRDRRFESNRGSVSQRLRPNQYLMTAPYWNH